jgi:hypothetical protein
MGVAQSLLGADLWSFLTCTRRISAPASASAMAIWAPIPLVAPAKVVSTAPTCFRLFTPVQRAVLPSSEKSAVLEGAIVYGEQN